MNAPNSNTIRVRHWLSIDDGSLRGIPSAVLRVVEGMAESIEVYVWRQLHPDASPGEFRDRFYERLKKNIPSPPPPLSEIHAIVEKTSKDLIHDLNRTEFRRTRRVRWCVGLDECADQSSTAIEEELVRESQVAAVLHALSPEEKSILEQLYGLRNSNTVTRAEMAKKLGLRRNTLDQRLRRIFSSVRNRLGEI